MIILLMFSIFVIFIVCPDLIEFRVFIFNDFEFFFPSKGRRYHIQEYQQIKKKNDKEEKEREDLERQAGIKPKKKEATKKKRDKDDIFNFVDGQVGFHKDGVQFVKKKFKR